MCCSLQITGDIKYNGVPAKDFETHKAVAYVGQVDQHLGKLTVRETLEYACKFEMGNRSQWNINKILHEPSVSHINKLDGIDDIELGAPLTGINTDHVLISHFLRLE